MKFQTVSDTRDRFKLAMVSGSYGCQVPESFYTVNRAISEVLGSNLPATTKHWYIYLLTLGLEQSNRWLLGKPIISQSHLEVFRVALGSIPLHAVNTEVMLNFMVQPEVIRLVLNTLVQFFDSPQADQAIISASSGVIDARYFLGLPLNTRLKLHSVWSDPFGHLANSVNSVSINL